MNEAEIEKLRKSLRDSPAATLCVDSEPSEEGRKYHAWIESEEE